MKGLIKKASKWICLITLFCTGMGVWDIYKERNLTLDPQKMAIENIADPKESIIYADIAGGVVDAMNILEYTTERRSRKTKIKRTTGTDYFIPVLSPETGKAVYIVEVASEPDDILSAESISFKGILQSSEALPTKVKEAYSQTYTNTNFYFLDSNYRPETLLEKVQGLSIFVIPFLISLAIFLLVSRKPKVQD